MDKISRGYKLGNSYNTDYKEFDRIFNKVNELVEGYNEMMKRLDMHLRHHTEDAARKI